MWAQWERVYMHTQHDDSGRKSRLQIGKMHIVDNWFLLKMSLHFFALIKLDLYWIWNFFIFFLAALAALYGRCCAIHNVSEKDSLEISRMKREEKKEQPSAKAMSTDLMSCMFHYSTTSLVIAPVSYCCRGVCNFLIYQIHFGAQSLTCLTYNTKLH